MGSASTPQIRSFGAEGSRAISGHDRFRSCGTRTAARPRRIAVRDSKDPEGPAFTVSPAAFIVSPAAFIVSPAAFAAFVGTLWEQSGRPRPRARDTAPTPSGRFCLAPAHPLRI
ncbi:DUF397 domain-containing protein [Streptomyces vinaceus]|uniref:DUF397 domain-containing protein n=1 Tax=Streptomyces vinaceus TaxID=1960 RepID=UPI0038083F79